MNEIVLSRKSSESDLKRYFMAVLELSKSDNKFPINLDEVWPLVYPRKDHAVRELKKAFFEGEDYITVPKIGEGGKFASTDYYLSLSCMEYFIARKVRPVFNVYREVFHRVAEPVRALPTTYKDALRQLLQEVEEKERLQLENKRLQDDVQSQRVLAGVLQGENEMMKPKARVYDQVINTQYDANLSTTSAIANEIGMSGQKLNKMLTACGIIYRTVSGEYLFCSEYLRWNLGKLISTVVNEEKGYIRTYIKWNTRGRAYIHALNDTNWDKRRAWHRLKEGKEVYVV